jgi:hypothetical protein
MPRVAPLGVMKNLPPAAPLAAGGRRPPPHADPNLPRAFLAVYRSGSFTAAAPPRVQ